MRCLVRAHRSRHNPLRAHGRLGAVCGIEFAAQAVALHGALLDPNAGHLQRGGYLVALREVEVHVDRLDDIGDDLLVSAVRLVGDETTVLYQFRLWSLGSYPSDWPGDDCHRPATSTFAYPRDPAMTQNVRRALVTGGSGEIGAAIA